MAQAERSQPGKGTARAGIRMPTGRTDRRDRQGLIPNGTRKLHCIVAKWVKTGRFDGSASAKGRFLADRTKPLPPERLLGRLSIAPRHLAVPYTWLKQNPHTHELAGKDGLQALVRSTNVVGNVCRTGLARDMLFTLAARAKRTLGLSIGSPRYLQGYADR
jgi:hypothetical protein